MLSRIKPDLTQLRMKVLMNGKAVADRTMMTKIWQQIERETMMESRPSDPHRPENEATTVPANCESGLKVETPSGL